MPGIGYPFRKYGAAQFSDSVTGSSPSEIVTPDSVVAADVLNRTERNPQNPDSTEPPVAFPVGYTTSQFAMPASVGVA
jgi:hypothetical protein